MQINNLKITHRFNFFEHLVVDTQKQIWQLAHFSRASKRTRVMRKITYNKQRNAYRVNNSWVKKQDLLNLCYPVDEVVNKKLSNNFWDEY